MHKRFAVAMLASLPLAALAQAPAPAAPPISVDVGKGEAATPTTPRSSATRPGSAPPPLNIRIREAGVKLPACTAESREGEACKK